MSCNGSLTRYQTDSAGGTTNQENGKGEWFIHDLKAWTGTPNLLSPAAIFISLIQRAVVHRDRPAQLKWQRPGIDRQSPCRVSCAPNQPAVRPTGRDHAHPWEAPLARRGQPLWSA